MYRPNLKSVALPVPEIIDSPWVRRSRSSKVVDFNTNRKRVCDFPLVCHSNLGHILLLAPFRRYCRFLCSCMPTPIPPQFWGCCRCTSSPMFEPARANYFRSIPTCVKNIPQRHRQTDGRTGGLTTYCCMTALCVASRGINASDYRTNNSNKLPDYQANGRTWLGLEIASNRVRSGLGSDI